MANQDSRPRTDTARFSSLDEVRAAIDDTDRRIVALIADRCRCAMQSTRFKSAADGVKDTAREEQVIAHVRALALQEGVEADLVETLYRDMITGFVRVEQSSTGQQPQPVVENTNVASFDAILPPEEMKQRVRLTPRAVSTVLDGRRTVEAILDRRDPRFMVLVGPCTVHDTVAGLDYARRLRAVADEVSDTVVVLMRVFFEKPRSSLAWEGFTHDPRLDGSFRIKQGIEAARRFLLDVNELGLPIATEALDPVAPHYRGDLVTWTGIGAGTSESQIHRNLASGLSTPVGFKNGTDGDVEGAIGGIVAALRPHAFLGINDQGRSAVIRTRGNPYGHLILRGGDRPNFDSVSVSLAERALARAKAPLRIIVDCSHANSWSKPELQPLVARDVANQVRDGNTSICGVMIESFLEPGNQPIPQDPSQLRYGCSVTDPCLGWDATAATLRELRDRLRDVVAARRRSSGQG